MVRCSDSSSLRRLSFAAIGLLLACLDSSAWAHKVYLHAVVRGGQIEGEVVFEGGQRVRHPKIEVVDAEGAPLGAVEGDDQGRFVFPIERRVEHRLTARAGFGHSAQWRLAVDELPADVGTRRGADTVAGSVAGGRDAAAGAPHTLDELAAEVGEMVEQLAGLRRDLQRSRTELRLRDVLGGLGWIVGVWGLVAYLQGRVAKPRREAPRGSATE